MSVRGIITWWSFSPFSNGAFAELMKDPDFLFSEIKMSIPDSAYIDLTGRKFNQLEKRSDDVKKYASLMGVSYNRITIRHQQTRWGSCTKTGNSNFNCLIMKMPETVRDYVIIHELAHRKELNHSTKFWAVVSEYCPWYKEAKLWLKDNGPELN